MDIRVISEVPEEVFMEIVPSKDESTHKVSVRSENNEALPSLSIARGNGVKDTIAGILSLKDQFARVSHQGSSLLSPGYFRPGPLAQNYHLWRALFWGLPIVGAYALLNLIPSDTGLTLVPIFLFMLAKFGRRTDSPGYGSGPSYAKESWRTIRERLIQEKRWGSLLFGNDFFISRVLSSIVSWIIVACIPLLLVFHPAISVENRIMAANAGCYLVICMMLLVVMRTSYIAFFNFPKTSTKSPPWWKPSIGKHTENLVRPCWLVVEVREPEPDGGTHIWRGYSAGAALEIEGETHTEYAFLPPAPEGTIKGSFDLSTRFLRNYYMARNVEKFIAAKKNADEESRRESKRIEAEVVNEVLREMNGLDVQEPAPA